MGGNCAPDELAAEAEAVDKVEAEGEAEDAGEVEADGSAEAVEVGALALGVALGEAAVTVNEYRPRSTPPSSGVDAVQHTV